MKINEQIAFLRKEKCVTQEELANAIGVSNQAVSKWENGQNCPDIELLPQIAEYFNVSVDQLTGRSTRSGVNEIILETNTLIDNNDSYRRTVLPLAFAIHSMVVRKEMSKGGMNDTQITRVLPEEQNQNKWGVSLVNLPKFTTLRRGGSVFYSSNDNLKIDNPYLRHTAAIFRKFGDITVLKIFAAIYKLTKHAEDAYSDILEIAEQSGVSIEKVETVLKMSFMNI